MASPGVRRRQPATRQSIRTRLLALLLGLTTIAVLTVGYLGINSVQNVGESARQISAEALRTQAEEYLRQVTIGDAQANDLILRSTQRDAENMALYAASIFERPDVFAGGAYWQVEDHMFTAPDGQYMNDESDVSSAFAPDFVDVDEELLTALELSAYLDLVLVPTYESDPNTVAVYMSTEQETTRYHPNINLGAVVPPDFQITQRPWYLGANPENNPERAVVWSSIYVDATGQGLMVTAAAPIYTDRDGFIGTVGIDVTLQDISASVEEARLLGGGYSFLIDNAGYAIALPERGYQDILGRSVEPDEAGADLSGITTEFAPVLAAMMAGAAGFDTLEVGGRELLVAYAPLESIGWSLANVVEVDEVLQAMAALQEELETSTRSLLLARILPVGAGILAAVVVIGLLLTNRLINPIRRLATAAQQIGTGQWDTPLPRAGDDEIGVLSQAFATMTVRLRELMASLEQRVAERTRDLEHRSVQLEAAAQVAREAAAIRDVDQLLDETVRLISARFGFYHAGIFLLDAAEEYAVLRATSSEGGQRMLTREHKLKVGEVGIVGYVAGTGNPRIALDVGEDAAFFDNPDLPSTRSEMAVPLRVRDRIIGVLDVQSVEAEAFSGEDAAVLQTLADQVALAISNAQLLQQAQERLEAERRAYGELSREAWRDLLHTQSGLGFLRDERGISPASELWRPRMETALQTGETTPGEGDATALAVPIKVRDHVVGVIDAHRPDDAGEWTPEQMALLETLADRLGVALESARLYQDTQRRAAHERLVGEITARVRASLDPDTILKTTVRELGRALSVEQVTIEVTGPEEHDERAR